MIDAKLLDRCCRGVASLQEGDELRDAVYTLVSRLNSVREACRSEQPPARFRADDYQQGRYELADKLLDMIEYAPAPSAPSEGEKPNA